MSQTTEHLDQGDTVRTIALSAIEVREGHNPRVRFDERSQKDLEDSIRRHGLLQPLVVRETGQPGTYELIAGERRYRACLKVGMTQVPALVRARVLALEHGGALVDALVENLHRCDPTPTEEASAYQRLLDAGLTPKGVCETLAITRDRLRGRLELLRIPAELHPAIDAGEIPLAAVPALVALVQIHPQLPACAQRRVDEQPRDNWHHPLTWADVAADPIGSVTCLYSSDTPQLPDGLYEQDASYPLASFALSDRARRDLARLAELDPAWAGDGPELMITRDMVEHARTLGAAHASPHGTSAIVVGADVAGELAAKVIARRLRDTRARQREHAQRQQAAAAGVANGTADPQSEREQERRAQRDSDREARLAAETYNDQLGAAIVKTLSTVKIDAPVVKILAAVDLRGELENIALRGARYGFPGWVTEITTASGKTKHIYLERDGAVKKAQEYLAGADTPAQIAGRCVALIAMAVLADDRCVARSSRQCSDLFHGYRPSRYAYSAPALPWTRDVVALVEELCLRQLPAAATQRLRDRADAPDGQPPAQDDAVDDDPGSAETDKPELAAVA